MIRLLTGDVRAVLPTLPDASVQCVVTSPPYYGLRDYGTAQWEGGDAGCEHQPIGTDRGSRDELPKPPAGWAERAQGYANGKHCPRCGARRIDAQIGLEAMPEAFIVELVAVFRLVRRVLRDDGTVWLNMGDSYSAGKQGRTDHGSGDPTSRLGPKRDGIPGGSTMPTAQRLAPEGTKPKDLLMMPARVALALQADGWWLRSDIIWAKPNPMPESCRDRPTSAHEHVFLLTKRSRYFYDADAVREPHDDKNYEIMDGRFINPKAAGRVNRAGYKPQTQGWATGGGGIAHSELNYNPAGRNLRNVWTIATAPFPAAHFATFPPELAERCIRAGTSEKGACPQCGAPWYRVTSSSRYSSTYGDSRRADVPGSNNLKGLADEFDGGRFTERMRKETTTIGWHPSCGCDKPGPVVPCVILDPFSGAGTALLVADRLGRDAVGIDLSHAYVEMARERLHADCPLFADISPPPAEDPEDERMADLFATAAD